MRRKRGSGGMRCERERVSEKEREGREIEIDK